MILQILTFVFMREMMFASADYGVVSNFPELKIQDAGPSEQYPWVGYTSHFPKTVPRPLLLHKWHPYIDPTYTAFWVSEKDPVGGIGAEFKGLGGGGLPHGFGDPKPSSIKGGNLIDSFSGPAGPLLTYQEPGHLASSSEDFYVQPNAIVPSAFDNSIDIEPAIPAAPAAFPPLPLPAPVNTYVQPDIQPIEAVEVYQEPAQIIQASPVVHTVGDDFDDGGFIEQEPRGIYKARPSAILHQDAFIEPGQLVHSEQYAGDSVYQAASSPRQQPIIPLVKPPHSEPLPLEYESGSVSNALLEQVYNVKRSSQ